MKKNLLACIIIVFLTTSFNTTSSPLEGAWKVGSTVIVIKDGYYISTTFDKEKKAFYGSHGGSLKQQDKKFTIHIEFDTHVKDHVGATEEHTYHFEDGRLITRNSNNGAETKWQTIDDGRGDLAGNWRISGRMQGNKMNPINPGPRKTLKLLTATRFQWMAINTETKEFFGTGGGTYTFKDGKYTENIEFFSRDSSRVGASLAFDGKVENNIWTHKGMNSRGEPLHEEWKREK